MAFRISREQSLEDEEGQKIAEFRRLTYSIENLEMDESLSRSPDSSEYRCVQTNIEIFDDDDDGDFEMLFSEDLELDLLFNETSQPISRYQNDGWWGEIAECEASDFQSSKNAKKSRTNRLLSRFKLPLTRIHHRWFSKKKLSKQLMVFE